MRLDLRSLPRIRDSWSYLYLEHARIEQSGRALVAVDVSGRTLIPSATLSLLVLGPGTTITHEAVKNLATSGAQLVWTGEDGVRFYAHGLGHTRNSRLLQRQAVLASSARGRLEVARRMYLMRFGEEEGDASIRRLRGLEGVRVREAYARASRATGVPWSGRRYVPGRVSESDPVNQALTAANACLYGICHAGIVSLGASPGLGFIHVGRAQSFVYDIADLYKCETTIPAAFEAAAADPRRASDLVRTHLRHHFVSTDLLKRVAQDIVDILDVKGMEHDDDDPGGALWDPDAAFVPAGQNHGLAAP